MTKKELLAKISEIKALSMPAWWDLQASYGLYKLIYGKERSAATPANGDEMYMAILPGEQVGSESAAGVDIRKVETSAAFAEWAAAVNAIIFGGYPDIHPENHWHLCEKGLINCFACYDGCHAVSFASVMDNEKTCSPEFVATDPSYRRRGFARAVCSETMMRSFGDSASIITLRALEPGTRELYTSLGYRIYNRAL